MIILSGIAPGSSGTGMVLSHLIKEASARSDVKTQFIFAPDRYAHVMGYLKSGRILQLIFLMWKRYRQLLEFSSTLQRESVLSEDRLILLHPQTIGFKRCIELIENRKKPLWLFLMDSSFFCIQSYNYILGENQPCLRCLGGEDISSMEEFNCESFPPGAGNNIEEARNFIKVLKKHVNNHHVKILTQSKGQADLASKHFGEKAVIKVAGIWGEDWKYDKLNDDQKIVENSMLKSSYDVVYHGSQHPAKGAFWAVSVAQRCPEISFLFPFNFAYCNQYMSEGFSKKNEYSNIDFIPITWNTGLHDAVVKAKMVLIPSIWSAPVEGAIIKSIPISNSVGVVNNPTSFSAEINSDIILHLNSEVNKAADELKKVLADQWKPTQKQRTDWHTSFANSNSCLLERLIQNTSNDNC